MIQVILTLQQVVVNEILIVVLARWDEIHAFTLVVLQIAESRSVIAARGDFPNFNRATTLDYKFNLLLFK